MKNNLTLNDLTAPEKVVVVGASNDPTRIGGRPISYMLKNNFEGSIYPVNPKYENIQGIKSYSSIDQIPSDIDFAIVATDSKPGLHDQVVSFIEFCKYKTFDYRLATIFDAKRALNSIINIENLIKQ